MMEYFMLMQTQFIHEQY